MTKHSQCARMSIMLMQQCLYNQIKRYFCRQKIAGTIGSSWPEKSPFNRRLTKLTRFKEMP